MLFFVVFALGMCGFAMVCVGEFPWLGRRRMPARSARWAGTLLLIIFPLVFASRLIVNQFDGGEELALYPASWVVTIVCGLGALIVLVRGGGKSKPAPRPRMFVEPVLDPVGEPFAAPVAPPPRRPAAPTEKPAKPAPAKPRPAKQPPQPPPAENNPFDFN